MKITQPTVKSLTKSGLISKQFREKNPNYYKQYRASKKIKSRPASYWAIAVKKWRLNNPEEYRLQRYRRRQKTRGIRIDKERISNWNSRVCGICGELIIGAYHIDHIVPLSKGGEHCSINLQLAHPRCNLSKYNKLQTENADATLIV